MNEKNKGLTIWGFSREQRQWIKSQAKKEQLTVSAWFRGLIRHTMMESEKQEGNEEN